MIRGFAQVVNHSRLRGSAVGFVAAAVLLTPRPCIGQGAAPPVALKTRDLGVYVGHFNVQRERENPFSYDTGLDAVLGTIGAGYYLTEHVKTEIEVSRSGEAYSSGSIAVNRPDVPSYFRVYTNNETTTQLVSVAQSCQFFHNAWFHPFVTAGVDLAWDRTRIQVPEQRYYPAPVYGPAGTPPQVFPPVVIPGRSDEVTRRFSMRAFGGGGFKAYFTQRAFFRTDVRVGASEARSVIARLGFGVDF